MPRCWRRPPRSATWAGPSPSWPKPPSGGWRRGRRRVVQTLFPLVVVMLGMAVFFLSVAYFIPLVQLIGRLTDP